MRERIVERIRIDPAFGPLRLAAEIKHRARLRIPGRVGGDDHVLLPDLDGLRIALSD